MEKTSFSNIFEILQSIIPDEWTKIVFYAQYSEGSYSMKYYLNLDNSEYIDCYKLSGISKHEIVKSFVKIDLELSKVRNSLKDENKWSVLTLQVEKDGKFKAEYEYSDISQNTVQYFEAWKKKYLN